MANSAIIVEPERTWDGNHAEPRYVDATSDGHKTRAVPVRARRAIRPAATSTGASGARFRQVIEGGDGEFDLDVMDVGMSPFFTLISDSVTSGLHSGASSTYDQLFTIGPAGPPANNCSIRTYKVVERRGTGTVDWYRYTGGRGTSWEIGTAVDGTLTFKLGVDYKTAAKVSDPSISPAEIVPATVFNWHDGAITLDGSALSWESFSLSGNTGVDVADKFISGRNEPMRMAAPEITGTASQKYGSSALYDLFAAGTEVDNLVATFEDTSVEYETGLHPKLVLTVSKVRITGDDPEISPDNPAMQTTPFEVPDTATITIACRTSDSYTWLA